MRIDSSRLRIIASLVSAALIALSIVAGVSLLMGGLQAAERLEDIHILEDTFLSGDITLKGSQSMLVEDATLLVDGNITLFEMSSLILRNATVLLEERTYKVPLSGDPDRYHVFSTRYSIELHDESRVEVHDSQLLNATPEHWRLLLRDASVLLADGLRTNEILSLFDDSSAFISNSKFEHIGILTTGSVRIENSSYGSLGFGGSTDLFLANLTAIPRLRGEWMLGDFTGVVHAENVTVGGRVRIFTTKETNGEIRGNITFGANATLWASYFEVENHESVQKPYAGRITRWYPIVVTQNDVPLDGVMVQIYDAQDNLVASGTSSMNGLVIIPIEFETLTWYDEFLIRVQSGGEKVEESVHFLTSTPLAISLPST